MKKNDIKKIRAELDKIDDRVISLLNRRGVLAQKICKIKKEFSLDFFNSAREAQIFKRLCGKNRGPFTDEDIVSIYTEIISATRSLETILRIAYLGPEATFTHQASVRYFGKSVKFHPVKRIPDVFAEVTRRACDYGVVPVENSSEGAVLHTLDMLIKTDLKITAEFMMPVSHCLLSKCPVDKIKIIYSHPQVFAQCREWLANHLPDAVLEEVSSTVSGIRNANKSRYAAAIAGKKAASMYNIPVQAARIEDLVDNHTRFLVIGNNMNQRTGDDKTSIAFSIKDRVAALYDMLIPFRKEKINLTKIESRPSKRKAWQYVFFVDFMGHFKDKNVTRALGQLRKQTVFMKLLGSYPVSKR